MKAKKIKKAKKLKKNWLYHRFSTLEVLLLGIVSGVLAAFANPGPGWWPLIFLSQAPLAMIIFSQSLAKRILGTSAYVIVYFSILIFWMRVFSPAALPAIIFVMLIYYNLAAQLSSYIYRRMPKYGWLALPLVFTSLEYLRTIGFVGFPYGNLAYALYPFTLFIQIAEITTSAGISFFIYLLGAAMADSILKTGFFRSIDTTKIKKLWYRPNRYLFIVLAFISLIIYGSLRIHQIEADLSGKKKQKVSLIQNWFDFNQPWTRNNKQKVFQSLKKLSTMAKEDEPALIVWPETALLDYYEYNLERNRDHALMYRQFFSTFNESGDNIWFLTGVLRNIRNPNFDYREKRSLYKNRPYKIYNSSMFINPSGEHLQFYSKQLLVPFAEWFPYYKWLPFIANILESAQASNFTPGEKKTLFKHPEFSFSVLICYEDVFHWFTRKVVRGGAEFLVVLTNDAWSMSERSEYIHFAYSVFRAVENRRAVLRATNAGITAQVLASGQIIDQLKPFTESYVTTELTPSLKKSIYYYIGSSFSWLCLLLSFLLFVSSLFKKNIIEVEHE